MSSPLVTTWTLVTIWTLMTDALIAAGLPVVTNGAGLWIGWSVL